LTKLGVTYLDEHQQQQHFAALIVYKGNDYYNDLDTPSQPPLSPFPGNSAAFHRIFAVSQHFIATGQAFLSGD
jgi:hypothetical protein